VESFKRFVEVPEIDRAVGVGGGELGGLGTESESGRAAPARGDETEAPGGLMSQTA